MMGKVTNYGNGEEMGKHMLKKISVAYGKRGEEGRNT